MKVIKNSILYTGVTLLQKAMGFFLLPVYTLYLSTTDYGTTGLIATLVGLLSAFYLVALQGAGAYFTFQFGKDSRETKELWSTIFIFVAANSILISILLAVFHKALLSPFLKGLEFRPYLALGIAITFFSSLYTLYQNFLSTFQMGKKYSLTSVAYFLINITCTILFLVVFKMKAVGFLIALLLANVSMALYGIYDILSRTGIAFNASILRKSLLYSLPLFPHQISGWVIQVADRFFLNNIADTSRVGVYNIGFQLGNIILVVTASVTQAYGPWFFETVKLGEEGYRKIVRFVECFIVLYCLLALGIGMFSKEVLSILVSEEFRIGWTVVPLLCFSAVFNGIYCFFVASIFEKNTRMVPVITFVSAITSLVLNYLLIPEYGIMGASAASLLGMFFCSLLTYAASRKLIPIPYDWKRLFLVPAGFLAMACVSYWSLFGNPWMAFFFKLALYAAAVSICFFVYRTDWITFARSVLQRGKA